MVNSVSAYASHAVRATDFINSIGINTHIDFRWTSYNNTQTVIDSINYLGIKHLRDSANDPAVLGPNGLWQRVADATGAKFDAFMAQGSATFMQTGLTYIPQLASQGILNFIEGGNEEDVVALMNGSNSLEFTALFQQTVYAMGQLYGLPVINMSFGKGWDVSPTGNYGTVGDLSAYADYANAHTYFGSGNQPHSTISYMNHVAQLAAQEPVMVTEMGWYTNHNPYDNTDVTETVQAKYMLSGLLDSYLAGTVKTYLYELLDQKATGTPNDNYGLFYADGTPKEAATALHNLTTLLGDRGANAASFREVPFTYKIDGLQDSDRSMLMQKSDGTYWLAIWNESRLSHASTGEEMIVPDHAITLNLGEQATSLRVYDPLQGTDALQSFDNVGSVGLSLPDHPILVQINLAAASSRDLSLSMPASINLEAGETVEELPLLVQDRWAASRIGTMALNISAGKGFIHMQDRSGNDIAGSGTHMIKFKGTFDQLNDALETLSYTAGLQNSLDALKINVWNQSGYNITQSVQINVQDLSSATTITGTSGKDILHGGAGNDTLTGGLNADIFRFTSNHIGTVESITDFSVAQGDKINLHDFGLDVHDFVAMRGLTGDKSFNYNPYLYDSKHQQYTQINIDINGDRQSDFTIRLEKTVLTLHDSDFLFM